MQLINLLRSAGFMSTRENPDITGLASDSRSVCPGFLFAALPGTRQKGSDFITQAVANGAAAVLMSTHESWPDAAPARPVIFTDNPRRGLALLAAAYEGRQPDCNVAITGTNGKTSTADFLRQIWRHAGLRSASVGTLGVVSDTPVPSLGPVLTTPDSITLSRTLAQLHDNGTTHVALEASSHGLAQFRLDGVQLRAAGFSNFSRDHMDYHGSEAEYRCAKLRILDLLVENRGPVCVNADMDEATLVLIKERAQDLGLGLHLVGENGGFIKLLSCTPAPSGQELAIEHDGRLHRLSVPLVGRYQVDNILLAAALAMTTLGEAASVLQALPQLKGVRGRLEYVGSCTNGAAVYVDYAHTPDALVRLLRSLRPHTTGRLHIIFGAGGDRDRGKRPLMGRAAQEYADCVVITDDNPRTEDPKSIRQDILKAAPGAIEIADRKEAIRSVIARLQHGDVLVIAGKGHETYQITGHDIIDFDDAEVARNCIGNPAI